MLKLQYFGHLIWRTDSLVKTHAGKDSGQEEKGATEDEIVGCHHWLNGHKFEQTPEVAKDREAWRAIIHGVAMSQTQLSEETTKSSPRVLALSLPPFFFFGIGDDMLDIQKTVYLLSKFYTFNFKVFGSIPHSSWKKRQKYFCSKLMEC